MLQFLQGRISRRKARFFACACCRRVSDLTSDAVFCNAIDLAEQIADDAISKERYSAMVKACTSRWPAGLADAAAQAALNPDAMVGALTASQLALNAIVAATADPGDISQRRTTEEIAQARLLRCISGDPFIITPRSTLITRPSVTIATQWYKDHNIQALCALAEILEESGADQRALDHFREPGDHARGCWVIDEILGKS
jgi:hypothetical protein